MSNFLIVWSLSDDSSRLNICWKPGFDLGFQLPAKPILDAGTGRFSQELSMAT